MVGMCGASTFGASMHRHPGRTVAQLYLLQLPSRYGRRGVSHQLLFPICCDTSIVERLTSRHASKFCPQNGDCGPERVFKYFRTPNRSDRSSSVDDLGLSRQIGMFLICWDLELTLPAWDMFPEGGYVLFVSRTASDYGGLGV